ncbi:MAG TPA: hypothetical protein VN026_18345 [Bacteroidia bacterium]|jgi:hypothetical protein|nr:hypothetical protein [Bacteroidia bacterium]
MAAETQYTAQTGIQQVTTANSNLDGTTGTYCSAILTGASSGTLIVSITCKAVATTTEGMIRLFVSGGGATRMIMEIPVGAVKPDSNDEAFEYKTQMNFPLQSGYTLIASTQNAETFNIIAEGLDWTYFTSMVRPDSTKYTANTGINSVSTANTNLDGTGTLATILTAGASATYNGCLIESVTVKSTAFATGTTTTPGMVRLFLYDGVSVTRLLTEIKVPPVTQSGTLQSFYRKIPLNFNLKAGYSIKASTEKGDTFSVICEGKDWNYPVATQVTNYTPASGTSVTTEELLHSLQVPANVIASGGLFEVYASVLFTASTNNKTFRIYVNTSNTLTSATLLGTAIANSASVASVGFARTFPVINDTTLECLAGTTSSLTSEYNSSGGTSANVTVPSVSAGFWVLFSGQKVTAGETDTIRWSMVRKLF